VYILLIVMVVVLDNRMLLLIKHVNQVLSEVLVLSRRLQWVLLWQVRSDQGTRSVIWLVVLSKSL